ncbi:hypothetical protein BCR43DRAFT_101592 [Syncephalastrum racemosum]|uniref:Sds3-like-domain-containing protein n=1 Tax=Syncephalastrum racemosum TaxID=13706 RepID=A0A1X2H1E2_SYNRA|nr:hypothetical protein BCR43DRAFT_101592 [Syncephalastrum racemosum]
MEEVADLEKEREKRVSDAQCFMTYQITALKTRISLEITTLEDEYETERHSLYDVIMQTIEDRRKQVREDRENDLDAAELFHDAYTRLHNHRRNLRKRNQLHLDRSQHNGSPSRHEHSRRRQNRQNTMYNIHATPGVKEQEELDQDLADILGVEPGNSKRQTSSAPGNASRQR